MEIKAFFFNLKEGSCPVVMSEGERVDHGKIVFTKK